MDEKEKNPYNVNFAEASKLTIEHMEMLLSDGNEENETKCVKVAVAGADALAKVLFKVVADLWFMGNHRIPCFMIFPAAFQIAEKTWEKLMEQDAPAGFLEDALPAIEQIVKWSEEEGLLHSAEKIGMEIKEKRGAKNGE